MRLRGLEKGTPPGTRGPAPAVPLPSGIVRRHVLLGAAITALGGLLFGYDTGVISGALLFIGKDFPGLTSFDKELLTSILLIGALIGALAAGRIADRVGRRPTVLGTAALFVAGGMLAAFSPSYGVLVGARVVIGMAVGSASMVVPLYIELSVVPLARPPKSRLSRNFTTSSSTGLLRPTSSWCRMPKISFSRPYNGPRGHARSPGE